MKLLHIVTPFLFLAPVGFAQLTPDQKVADFMQLAGLYAKNYAPYELKRDLFGFDLYNVGPWLDKVKQSKTDIDFYDVLAQYVGSLLSGHDVFLIPSDFAAWLHFTTDVYDGKALIDSIDRSYLSRSKYPFTVGDEVVSVDGIAAADWIAAYNLYANFANPISRKRSGAGAIPLRVQVFYPRAAQHGDNATVVIQRQTGPTETYTIPWDKSGTALINEGPVPSPRTLSVKSARAALARPRQHPGVVKGVDPNDDGSWTTRGGPGKANGLQGRATRRPLIWRR